MIEFYEQVFLSAYKSEEYKIFDNDYFEGIEQIERVLFVCLDWPDRPILDCIFFGDFLERIS